MLSEATAQPSRVTQAGVTCEDSEWGQMPPSPPSVSAGLQHIVSKNTKRLRTNPYPCCRDPWVLPVEAGARQAAIRAKQGLAQGAGGASDHLALVKAFNGWSAARRAGQERGYCSSNFLSSSTMMMVNGMRTQLLGELQVFLIVQHTKHMLLTCADMTVHVHPVHAVQASLQLQLASNFQ